MIGFLSFLANQMKRNNEVVKTTVIEKAKLQILDVSYSPAKSFFMPDYVLMGDPRSMYINQSCVIKFMYDGKESYSTNVRFYLEDIRDAKPDENGELFVYHDILVKEYRHGYKEFDVYYADEQRK